MKYPLAKFIFIIGFSVLASAKVNVIGLPAARVSAICEFPLVRVLGNNNIMYERRFPTTTYCEREAATINWLAQTSATVYVDLENQRVYTD